VGNINCIITPILGSTSVNDNFKVGDIVEVISHGGYHGKYGLVIGVRNHGAPRHHVARLSMIHTKHEISYNFEWLKKIS